MHDFPAHREEGVHDGRVHVGVASHPFHVTRSQFCSRARGAPPSGAANLPHPRSPAASWPCRSSSRSDPLDAQALDQAVDLPHQHVERCVGLVPIREQRAHLEVNSHPMSNYLNSAFGPMRSKAILARHRPDRTHHIAHLLLE